MPKLTFYKPPEIQKGYIFNPHKSFFSVVVPEETTNLVYNPETQHLTDFYTVSDVTMELDPDDILFGVSSIHAVFKSGVLAYSVTPTLVPNTTYTFSVYAKGTGQMRLTAYNADLDVNQGVGRVVNPRPDIWTRHQITFTTPDPGEMNFTKLYIVAENADLHINGLQLEQKAYATTFCSGNLTGLITGESPKPYFWTSTPHYSPSVRLATTRDGGRLVSLETLGFHITGFNGFGLPEFNIVSTPVASGIGSVYQGSTIDSRDIELCGVLMSPSIKDFFYGRAMLGHSFQPNISGTAQALKLVYSVYDCDVQMCEQVEALAVYKSGLEGDIQSLFGEEICISLTMLDPLFKKLGNNAKTLNVFKSVGPEIGPVGTDQDGEWQTMNGAETLFGDIGVYSDLAIGPDNNLYISGSATLSVGDGSMVARWNGQTWESIGKAYDAAGVTVDDSGWSVEVMIPGPDGTLYVGGSFVGIGNENGVVTINDAVIAPDTDTQLNIARYRIATNEWEYIGRIYGTTGLSSIVMDLKLMQNNKIAIVGRFTNPQQAPSPETVYTAATNIIVYNPANNHMEYMVPLPYNNELGTNPSDIIYSIDQAPNGHIWVGGDMEFLGNLDQTTPGTPLTIHNVAVYGRYTTSGNVVLGFEGATGVLDRGNIVGGAVKIVKCSPLGEIFIGGDFTADQIYDDIHTDYPPVINVNSTSESLGSAAFGFAQLDPAVNPSGWFSPFILAMLNYDDPPAERTGIVYDMNFGTDGTLHIVGQFNFASVTLPNKDYEALPFDAGSDWSLELALSTQTVNCNGYTIWDGTNFIQPDILFDNGTYGFTDRPRIITAIELGALYSNRFSEHSSAAIPDVFQYEMPGTGGANINPGFSGSIFLAPEYEYTFIAKDIIFLDLGCNDYSKPIFVINGPGTLKSIRNETTGAIIYFNYEMVPGESLVLDLTQPLFTLSSNIHGNLRGIIKPNSTVSSFVLNSGNVGISVNVDLLTVEEDVPDSFIKWRTNYWSIDKGCGGNCSELGTYLHD